MKLATKKGLPSILGIAIADHRLCVVHATRTKSGLAVAGTATATLSVDPAVAPTDALGQEIKTHLSAAKLGERHCAVALPARWVVSLHTKVPELSADDLAGLLQMEAEKGMPSDLDELQIATSVQQTAENRYVTQLALRKEQLGRLTAALTAAGLKPVSFSLGLDALPGAVPPAGQGRVTLVLEAAGATLLIAAGGGIVALRTFDVTGNGSALARELRISVEQVPADLRAELSELHLLGDETLVRQLTAALREWAAQSKLALTRDPEPCVVPEVVAEAVALRRLAGGPVAPEFMPPRPSRWAVMTARYSSPRLAAAGFGIAALVLLVLLAFGWQQYRLWSLNNQWDGMAAEVKDLNTVTDRIREFRPWYDTSFRNLTIMKKVVECFPDNGTVSAKSFEIRGQGAISITGRARDNASLLHTLELLRQTKEVQDLKLEQIRGTTPPQFTFTFRWNTNSGS